MKHQIISPAQCLTLLSYIDGNQFDQQFIPEKNQWVFYEGQEAVLKFRLPISFNLDMEGRLVSDADINYIVLMIRSGIASLGYFEDGENLDHKVFRAYMVRKKQGKSQIKHLKTKGKSRAGSRVRLAETLEFFEEINTRMQDYFSVHRVDRIGISCATTLIPYLFGSKVPTPFEKNDPRIFKIPKHVQNPTYESLLETNFFLLKGELRSSDAGEPIFNQFMAQISIAPSPDIENEDW